MYCACSTHFGWWHPKEHNEESRPLVFPWPGSGLPVQSCTGGCRNQLGAEDRGTGPPGAGSPPHVLWATFTRDPSGFYFPAIVQQFNSVCPELDFKRSSSRRHAAAVLSVLLALITWRSTLKGCAWNVFLFRTGEAGFREPCSLTKGFQTLLIKYIYI